MNSANPTVDQDLPEQPRVLLVDDDEVNLLLTAIALRERGFDITEASSGEEALRTVSGWTPDIIVLDAMMPELDGFETCSRLREMPGFESTPVLMLTGLDDEASINRAYQVGATDFFVKSTQWSLLAGRLRYLLRSSRTRIELERSKARLARAQDLARMGSFEWHRGAGGFVLATEALRVFGYGPNEPLDFIGVMRMVPRDERQLFMRLLREVMAHNSVLVTDVAVTLVDGRQRVLHIEAEPEFNEHGNASGYTGVIQDVTDRRLAEDKIRQLANFDALTGLPNQASFVVQLGQALELARSEGFMLCVCNLDLDHFSAINERQGRPAGDQTLVEMARRLRSSLRRTERWTDQLARIGGDGFALILRCRNAEEARLALARLLDVVRAPLYDIAPGSPLHLTASLGATLFPQDASDTETLMRHAAHALYRVKRSGRDGFELFDTDKRQRSEAKVLALGRMQEALDLGELQLHFQPKVDLRRGKVLGMEALLRWHDPERGLLLPGHFLPLVEHTGLGVRIGDWVIEQALKQAEQWAADGRPLRIAVNVTARHLQSPDFAQRLDELLARHRPGLARLLMLEVLESAALADVAATQRLIEHCRGLGVQFALDDFGTGYSNLSYLKQLPVDLLKIDRSFVQQMLSDAHDRALVEGVISLARTFGCDVIAEGVESSAHAQALLALGCEQGQGHGIASAMPAELVPIWVQAFERSPDYDGRISVPAPMSEFAPAGQA